MYALAHLLIFRLHLPSRYTQHSLRMVMSLAAGIVLAAPELLPEGAVFGAVALRRIDEKRMVLILDPAEYDRWLGGMQKLFLKHVGGAR